MGLINIKFPQTSFPYLKQAIMPLLKCWQASYKMVVTGAIVAKYLPKRTSLSSQYLSKASIFFYVWCMQETLSPLGEKLFSNLKLFKCDSKL